MRKYLYCCIGLFGLFFLTGCSEKTLKCSRENSEVDMMQMKQELDVSFNNDKVSNLVFIMNVSLDQQLINDNPSIANDLADTASSEFESIKNKHGVSYSISKKDNGFSSKLKINFNKLDDATKKDIYLINHQGSYSSIKSSLEKDGYSCK